MNLFTRRDIAKHGAALAAVPVTLTPVAVLGQARPDTLPAHPASAQYTPRNLLRFAYPAEKVASILLPRGEWRPYPAGADRAAWEGLPADARKRFIEAGEQALKSEWPELSATLMLEYTRMGNRARFDDVGNFILFQNGEPVIIDVGPEAYSAKTFSKQRYEIWTMSSPYHNLPTIGGVAQGGGGVSSTQGCILQSG